MFNNIVFTFQKNATFKKISFTLNRLTKRRVVVFLFLKRSYGSKATSRLLQTVRIINTIFN